MDKLKITNFAWQMPGQLATGGKPSCVEQLEWLVDQGIEAVLSLEVIPDEIEKLLDGKGIAHLVVEAPDDYEKKRYKKQEPTTNQSQFVSYFGYVTDMPMSDWKKITMFINSNLEMGKRVFVHCSAGIRRSPRVVEGYLRQQLILTGWWLPIVYQYDYCIKGKWYLACSVADQTFLFNSDGFYRKLSAEELPANYDNDESRLLNFCANKNCRILIEQCSGPGVIGRYQFQIGDKRWQCIRGYGRLGIYESSKDFKLQDALKSINYQSKCLLGKGLVTNSFIIREDNRNWLLAHESLFGNRAKEAIEILILALDESDRIGTSRKEAANSLGELFRYHHRNQDYFNNESKLALRHASIRLKQVLADTMAGNYSLPSDPLMKIIVQGRIKDSIDAFREAIDLYRPS